MCINLIKFFIKIVLKRNFWVNCIALKRNIGTSFDMKTMYFSFYAEPKFNKIGKSNLRTIISISISTYDVMPVAL